VPLYEYECDGCGRFELIQKFSDGPLSACPKCGTSVEKLPSAPAIQFKGTGWYVTDYARKPSPDSSESDSPKSESSKSETTKAASDSTPTTTTSKDSSATGSSSAK